MAIDFDNNDVSTILNKIDSDIEELKSASTQPNDLPLTANVNLVTFAVYRAFYFRGSKREGQVDLDINSLSESEEERLTNMINMGHLRRLKA